MGGLLQDLRYGFRMLWKQRAVTSAAVLCLAFGIGATTVVYSAVDAMLFRQLPFADAARVLTVESDNEKQGIKGTNVSLPNILDVREQTSVFEEVGLYQDRDFASVSIYGVIAYSVAQRMHEFGIRMALGAQTRDVLRLILKQGLRLVSAGVVFGLIGAYFLTRLLSGLLYGVAAIDLFTFSSVPLVLISVALLACYVPARCTTKVDPMVALRHR